MEPVKYFAQCATKFGLFVKLSPAWLVSKEDNNPYNIKTRKILREFSDLNIPVGTGNITFPQGNALIYLKEYFDGITDPVCPYDEDPKDVRTISFGANGDVLGGNIYQNNILELIESYRP